MNPSTPIAPTAPRPSPEPLFRYLVGFEISQIFMAAHRLGIFKALLIGPLSAEHLLRRLELPEGSGNRLVQAGVSLGLLENRAGLLSNSPAVQTYLDPRGECYLGGLIDYYHDDIYLSCSRLAEAVVDNRPQVADSRNAPQDLFSVIEHEESLGERFLQAMHSLGLLEGRQLAAIHPFEKSNHLLDLGGGSGALSIALATQHPHLSIDIYDRPLMCRTAQKHIHETELNGRVRTVEGNFWTDPLPRGADTILLSMVLHDWSFEEGVRLLQRCADALPSGGTVLIYEQLLDENRCGPTMTCLTNLMMLLRTRTGSEYSESEYRAMLKDSGFHVQAIVRTPGLRHLISATKP